MPTSKAQLRRSLLKLRQELNPEDWQNKSIQLCQRLQTHPWFVRSQTVLAYFSFRHEPDLRFLFTQQKRLGFPRCVGKNLSWHYWSPKDVLPLQKTGFGLPEPHPDAPLLHPEEVDLILIPAVACDRQGYRLGYGGGFYDRMLSLPAWINTPTIGVVFEFARLNTLPIDPWDRPLHAIGTEAGIFMSRCQDSI